MFHIRQTQENDGPLIRGLRIAALTDAPYAFGARLEDVVAQSDHSFAEVAARHSTSEVSTSFILFNNAHAAGTIGAFFEQQGEKRAFICALWVEPAFRGASAAHALVSRAVDWLVERGANAQFAWVADSNARAIAFYRKHGFVATAETQPVSSDTSVQETLWRHDVVALRQ